jgi:hypothetical protein
MKPTCAKSKRERRRHREEADIAKGAGANLRRRWCVRSLDGARACMNRRPSDREQDHRNHHHDHHDGRGGHPTGKAEMADRGHQQRHAGDPAKARAVQRQADGHAALFVEPEAQCVGDHAKAGAGPAKGEHGVGEIELPGLADLADRDRGHSHHADARDHAIAGAEPLDRLADKGDQRRARQIEERRARRDQRRRPAVQPLQLGDINALAIEAEGPAKRRQQEANGDDAPAVVADRGFVNRGVVVGVQRISLRCCRFIAALVRQMSVTANKATRAINSTDTELSADGN